MARDVSSIWQRQALQCLWTLCHSPFPGRHEPDKHGVRCEAPHRPEVGRRVRLGFRTIFSFLFSFGEGGWYCKRILLWECIMSSNIFFKVFHARVLNREFIAKWNEVTTKKQNGIEREPRLTENLEQCIQAVHRFIILSSSVGLRSNSAILQFSSRRESPVLKITKRTRWG